jgi:hypothetical protein
MSLERNTPNRAEFCAATENQDSHDLVSLYFDGGTVKVAELTRPGLAVDFDRADELSRLKELPAGRPDVGAGTPYSDIVRPEPTNDVRFHLPPPIMRGAVVIPAGPGAVEVAPSAVPGPRVRIDNVGADPAFALRMRDEMDKLSPGVKKLLNDNGFSVVVTDQVVDAVPSLKGERPRGWPEGTTFANDDGVFYPGQRHIVIAERFEDKDGKDMRTNRAESVLHHETGHAVDAALGDFSQTAEFKAAYDKDVAAMTPDVKKKLEYLLQPGGSGQQETFAEVFAALNGSSANPEQTGFILQQFPETARLLQSKLAALT